ncbi:MAG: DNA-binding protein WhiA [Actinomycetota bacterium]
MRAPGGFTEDVRQELALVPLGTADELIAELEVLVALAGDDDGVVISASGPVARRTHRLVVALTGSAPEVTVVAPSGLPRRPSYRVRVPMDLPRVDGAASSGGTPSAPPGSSRRGGWGASADLAAARWRGALLAAGSLSAPGRAPHLEIAVRDEALVARLVEELGRAVPGGHALHDAARQRLVVKSGGTLGDLLARTGATSAFLAFDERRLRRQLRDDAMRAANADAANLKRAAGAAAMRISAIEGIVARDGWEGIPEPLRAVALARVANPEASLAELAELLGLARSTVHRRLRTLDRLAAGGSEGSAGSVGTRGRDAGRADPNATDEVPT